MAVSRHAEILSLTLLQDGFTKCQQIVLVIALWPVRGLPQPMSPVLSSPLHKVCIKYETIRSYQASTRWTPRESEIHCGNTSRDSACKSKNPHVLDSLTMCGWRISNHALLTAASFSQLTYFSFTYSAREQESRLLWCSVEQSAGWFPTNTSGHSWPWWGYSGRFRGCSRRWQWCQGNTQPFPADIRQRWTPGKYWTGVPLLSLRVVTSVSIRNSMLRYSSRSCLAFRCVQLDRMLLQVMQSLLCTTIFTCWYICSLGIIRRLRNHRSWALLFDCCAVILVDFVKDLVEGIIVSAAIGVPQQ